MNSLARIAAAAGHPSRARMLDALLDGREHSASELVRRLRLARSTVSHHLDDLERAGWIVSDWVGRHRVVRLRSADVASALERLLAAVVPMQRQLDPVLAAARTCFDHLAGRAGVTLTERLIERRWLDADFAITNPRGWTRLGVDLTPRQGRPLTRPCLDWTERRPHLGGLLGARLFERLATLGCVVRVRGGRSLRWGDRAESVLTPLFGAGPWSR